MQTGLCILRKSESVGHTACCGTLKARASCAGIAAAAACEATPTSKLATVLCAPTLTAPRGTRGQVGDEALTPLLEQTAIVMLIG